MVGTVHKIKVNLEVNREKLLKFSEEQIGLEKTSSTFSVACSWECEYIDIAL